MLDWLRWIIKIKLILLFIVRFLLLDNLAIILLVVIHLIKMFLLLLRLKVLMMHSVLRSNLIVYLGLHLTLLNWLIYLHFLLN